MQNKPNLVRRRRIENEYKLNYNKGLQKKRWFRSPNKQTQFAKRVKIDAKCVFTKDYEEKCGYGLQKNKPNQTQSCPP